MEFCSKVTVKLLLSELENDGKKNILTSPLSYNAIMNMLAAGSSCDTLDQILDFLEHNNIEEVNSESSKFAEITREQPRKSSKRKIEDAGTESSGAPVYSINEAYPYSRVIIPRNIGESPTISFLNGIWVNQEYRLKDSFQDLIQNLYKAKVRSIDCAKPESVMQETNEWASASTNGLIKEVLRKEDIEENTILILGNALYFKGSWEEPFSKGLTCCKSFYLLNGEEIKVPFMTGCEKYSNQSFQDFQVARIPYSAGGDVNRDFAMYIFLPNEKDGIQNLLKNVDSNPKFFEQYCDLPNTKVDTFRIPKFKFSYLTEESPKIMKGMGLALPFDMENAEFNEMIKDEDLPKDQGLYVSKIIQKAFIEVNEEGTEAAAVTWGGICPGYSPPITKFIADHPFMFIIREEKSGILFFVGTVLNPLEA